MRAMQLQSFLLRKLVQGLQVVKEPFNILRRFLGCIFKLERLDIETSPILSQVLQSFIQTPQNTPSLKVINLFPYHL